MERIKKRWENEELIMIGREEAVADFHHKAEQVLSLNGEWNFLYLEAPEYAPEEFFTENYEDREWKKIPVPSCWSLPIIPRESIEEAFTWRSRKRESGMCSALTA